MLRKGFVYAKIKINRGDFVRRFFCLFIVIIILLTGCVNDNDKQISENKVQPSINKNQSKTIPQEYVSLIEDYNRIVTIRLNEDFEEKYNSDETYVDSIGLKYFDENSENVGKWSSMIVELISPNEKVEETMFNYYFDDLNNDGKQEAIWLKNDKNPVAIFTEINGKVYLLDAFWQKYSCSIEENKIYIKSSGGAYDISYYIKQVKGTSLETINEFGTEQNLENISYYQMQNDNKITITKELFDEFTLNFE